MRIRNTRKLENFQQIGDWRKANLDVNQSIVAMTYGGVAASDGAGFPAGHGGAIVGIVGTVKDDSTSGGIVAGSVTLNATIGGTVVGEDCILSASAVTRSHIFANRVPFTKAEKLGIKVTSASLWPVVNDYQAWLLINWDLIGNKSDAVATS